MSEANRRAEPMLLVHVNQVRFDTEFKQAGSVASLNRGALEHRRSEQRLSKNTEAMDLGSSLSK